MLILKWGGVLTHAGREQSETLGKEFRMVMYPGCVRARIVCGSNYEMYIQSFEMTWLGFSGLLCLSSRPLP